MIDHTYDGGHRIVWRSLVVPDPYHASQLAIFPEQPVDQPVPSLAGHKVLSHGQAYNHTNTHNYLHLPKANQNSSSPVVHPTHSPQVLLIIFCIDSQAIKLLSKALPQSYDILIDLS